jgi:hypothetical protein
MPTAIALCNGRTRVMMHEKIKPHHLERKAILHVRQSSAHQVLHNRESSTLQYAIAFATIDLVRVRRFPAPIRTRDHLDTARPAHRSFIATVKHKV